ncbi:hypothetical protein [Scytonema sp. PCC 10023]|uniref:hypothetical protein n=1 Tax=Scytonema sp. PCC 10023 TaxID=1680591 RepID=UPI0039C5F8BA
MSNAHPTKNRSLTNANDKAPRRKAQGAFVSVIEGRLRGSHWAKAQSPKGWLLWSIAYLSFTQALFYHLGERVGVGDAPVPVPGDVDEPEPEPVPVPVPGDVDEPEPEPVPVGEGEVVGLGFFLLVPGLAVVVGLGEGVVVVGLVVCAWTSDGKLATGMALATPKMRETAMDLTSLLIFMVTPLQH